MVDCEPEKEEVARETNKEVTTCPTAKEWEDFQVFAVHNSAESRGWWTTEQTQQLSELIESEIIRPFPWSLPALRARCGEVRGTTKEVMAAAQIFITGNALADRIHLWAQGETNNPDTAEREW